MTQTKALYAGTFDPLTNGHLYVIDESLKLFDSLVIGIGTNPAKKCMFTPGERWDIIKQEYPIVNCFIYENRLMVKVAQELGCTHLVRGIRDSQDLHYETQISILNSELVDFSEQPTTIFIPTPIDLGHISSSMVKGLIGFDDWEENISMYLPDASLEAIIKKVKEL